MMFIFINMYTGTLTLREERRLMAFENGGPRMGKSGRKYWGTGESCTVRGFMICTGKLFLGDVIEVDKMSDVCGTNGTEVYT